MWDPAPAPGTEEGRSQENHVQLPGLHHADALVLTTAPWLRKTLMLGEAE